MQGNVRPDSRATHLILRCAEALTLGRHRTVPIVDIDEKFNVQFFLTMLTRGVSLEEMMLVPQLTTFCVTAINLSRGGDYDGARSILEKAGQIHARADLSHETRLALEGFHHPAEAYLHYKMGDHDRAEALLTAALGCCSLLVEEGDYRMEGRRIQLVRNIVRVRVAAGRGADACSLAYQTMRYLQGEVACWPFPNMQCSSTPDTIEPAIRLVHLDQLLHEVSRALTTASSADPRKIYPALLTASGREAEVPRVRFRLGALHARATHDLTRYLEHAAAFFEEGPAHMPQTWEAAASEFIEVCRDEEPDVAARLQGGPSANLSERA